MQVTNKIISPMENRPYLTKPRIPVAVHCWYPTGDSNAPFITMMKFKEPDGDIVTIKDINNQRLEVLFPGNASVTEIRCCITYQNRIRDTAIFFHPRQLKWEMCFIN